MKRVKMVMKKPNPLFERWLEDWATEAASKNSPLQYYFSKALDSLRKYPLPLNSGKECLILEHFNSKLCYILDKKITDWQRKNVQVHKEINNHIHHDVSPSPTKASNKTENSNANKLIKGTVPINVKTSSRNPKLRKQAASKTIRCTPHNEDKGTLQGDLFDVILLVDVHETGRRKGATQTDSTVSLLTQLEVLFEIRHLNIGDFAWIARCRLTNKEFILPYIAERKRLDDLSASIKDGRYKKQKFRLRQSGIQNLIYIVEKYDKANATCISFPSLMQASVNVLIRDGFAVQHTDNHKGTLLYLVNMTNTLTKIYKEKYLNQGTKEKLDSNSLPSSMDLMTYEEFCRNTSKRINITVREMFVRHLIRLWGVSLEKAIAITEHYPTPYLLIKAINDHQKEKAQVLENIQFGENRRKIGSAISNYICELYLRKQLA